eukprot:476188_1
MHQQSNLLPTSSQLNNLIYHLQTTNTHQNNSTTYTNTIQPQSITYQRTNQINHNHFQIPANISNAIPIVINTSINNSNTKQEPMVTIPLSQLNHLTQTLNIYESFLSQMFVSNPILSNICNQSKTETINTLKINHKYNKNSTSNNNNNNNNAFYCDDASTLSETDSNTTNMPHLTPNLSSNLSSNTNESNTINISNTSNISGGSIKKECAQTHSKLSNLTTRSYNKKIGHNYGIGIESKIKKKLINNMKCGEDYVCGTCGKKYRYLCNLRSHSKVHTEMAHVCQYCCKKFGRRANYEEHVRIHTGEAPYKCNICNKNFRQRHRWKHHYKLNHKNVTV